MARRLNDAGEEGLVNPRTQSRPNRHRLLTDAQLGELDAWQLDRCLAL